MHSHAARLLMQPTQDQWHHPNGACSRGPKAVIPLSLPLQSRPIARKLEEHARAREPWGLQRYSLPQ